MKTRKARKKIEVRKTLEQRMASKGTQARKALEHVKHIGTRDAWGKKVCKVRYLSHSLQTITKFKIMTLHLPWTRLSH